MPNILCPHKIECPGTDSPFANLTSEDQDKDIFVGMNWGWGWNVPPLGSNWYRDSCVGVCTSEVSQADADFCAALNNLLCLYETWGEPGTYDNGGPIAGGGNHPVIGNPSTPLTANTNQVQACISSCPDGTPFIYVIPAGLIAGPNQVLANQMAYSVACRLAAQYRLCLSAMSPNACLDEFFSKTVTASQARAMSFVIVSGALPPGVTMTQTALNRVTFSGTPTTAGNYTFVLRATRSDGIYMQKTYTISVLGITTASPLPQATVGAAYNETLASAGGTGPYTYALESGTLPDGLTLSDTGNITGTPTTVQTNDFYVRVTDAVQQTCVHLFTCEAVTGCPALLATVVTVSGEGGVLVSGDVPGDVINPHKLFMGGAAELGTFDLDTNNYIAAFGAGDDYTSGIAYSPPTQRVGGIRYDGLNFYIRNFNAITGAVLDTSIAATGAYGDGLNYDSTNDRFLTVDVDAGGNIVCVTYNPTTFALGTFVLVAAPTAEVSSGLVHASGNNRQYHLTRDPGPQDHLRSFTPAGVLQSNTALDAAYNHWRLLYVPSTHTLWIPRNLKAAPFTNYMMVWDIASAAVVANILMPSVLASWNFPQHNAARNIVVWSRTGFEYYFDVTIMSILCEVASAGNCVWPGTWLNRFYNQAFLTNNLRIYE